ncbi:MAG: hypothetical protein QXO51_08680 [Halobacteria archaeon]
MKRSGSGKRTRRRSRSSPARVRDGVAGEVREMVFQKFVEEVDVLQDHLDRYIGRKHFGSLYVLFRALFTTIRKHTRKVFVDQLRAFVESVDEPVGPALLRRLMAHDIVTLYLRDSHPDYPKVRRAAEELALSNREFLAALVEAGVRMGAERWPVTYEEFHRAAFPLRSESKAILMDQFRKAQQIIDIVKRDPKIVNLPLGRGLILDVLEEGVRYSRHRIDIRLDEIYG